MKAPRLFNLLFRTPLRGYLATQLADPRGLVGRWAAAEMNRSNVAMSRWAVERLDLAKTDTVLEVGFGGAPAFGDLLARAHRVEGLDRSPTMVRAALGRFADAVERRKLFLGQGDLMDLPFAPNGFDAALSVNTVYFWPDAARGAAEFFRVLKPGGRLALGLRPGELTRRSGLTRHGFRAWEKDALVRLLEGAGFGAVRVDDERLSGAPVWAAFGRKPQP